MINIRKLESELWESADLLRASSKLTSNQYCMPVLGLIFLRYAYSRYKMVEAEIIKCRSSRGGPVTLAIIGKICNVLECDYGDIMTYVPDRNERTQIL